MPCVNAAQSWHMGTQGGRLRGTAESVFVCGAVSEVGAVVIIHAVDIP